MADGDLTATVFVVGAGPAGLGVALALRRAGIERVTVLEREHTPGGIPRHCGHRTFGLGEFHRPLSGPAYAARLVASLDSPMENDMTACTNRLPARSDSSTTRHVFTPK